jgi:hypothetical protein
MPLERERECLSLIVKVTGARVIDTPHWLLRPGKAECSAYWPLVQQIYFDLTALELPQTMRTVERRTVDGVLVLPDSSIRIFEFDEIQHFNAYRALTLTRYAGTVPLGFDPERWARECEKKKRLEGGGFAKEKPPLFPGENGRHRQRAFRDTLADIVPLAHGWVPTLRIGFYEVKDWLFAPDAPDRMAALLEGR